MVTSLVGKKLGMTQIFAEDGTVIPVTVIECGPCVVTQIKTSETDGYLALQVGFGEKSAKRTSKALMGHLGKSKTGPKRFIRELEWDGEGEFELGSQIGVDIFNEIKRVDVTGTSKGRGFQGVVKRHGFHGGPKSHGQSDRHRAPGSIGQSADPSRVKKGRRMAGHMGHRRRTARNLTVVRVDPERNCLLIKGAVPGPNGGLLIVRKTHKLGK
ncbi:MAG: 50S ribosomal protein L3 [Planctomycetes bacterium]|nr:50S ribosomal protein L3 [Planctomycetota bacterium]